MRSKVIKKSEKMEVIVIYYRNEISTGLQAAMILCGISGEKILSILDIIQDQ